MHIFVVNFFYFEMFKFGSRKDINVDYKCTVRLLDDTEVLQCNFQSEQKGLFLLEYTCHALNLIEKEYFGLRFVDSQKQRHWLDMTKPILKQVKGMNPILFCFRVKFYPPDPHCLKDELTRYQILLQLRRDLLHGRLYSSHHDGAMLAAYIMQSELGDYDPDEHRNTYVSEFKLLLKQTQKLEEKIAEIHQTQLSGLLPTVAEMIFLKKSCLLDTYGVDPHPVKDHKRTQLYLGINYSGILTFHGSRKTHHFKWPDIQKINYEGKMFIVHLLYNEKKHLVGFKCPSQAACHHLWKCAVEQRYFFTMKSSSEVPLITTSGGIFSRGCKLRYSGRVEKEMNEDIKKVSGDQPQFQRSFTKPPSFRKIPDGYSRPPSPQTDHFHLNEFSPQQIPVTSDCLLTEKKEKESAPSSPASSVECAEPPLPEEVSLPDETRVPLPEEQEEEMRIPRRRASRHAPLPLHADAARLLLLSGLFVLLLVVCLLVLLMESDSPLFSGLRAMPELAALRRQYYAPAKDYLAQHIAPLNR